MLKTLDSSVISFIVLLIIYFHSYSRSDRLLPTYKLFRFLVLLNIIMIVVDLLGWAFNGLNGQIPYTLNLFFNMVLYIATPMIPTVWVLYVYHLVERPERQIQKVQRNLLLLLIVNGTITLISVVTGWFFYIDASNLYHRGPLFFIHVAHSELLLLFSFIFVLVNRRSFQKRQFYAIMVFFIAPLLGSAMQVLNYGVSYNWTGVMLSMMIIYLHLQSRNLNTDYLTGVNNRLHVQEYLKEKIRNCSDKRCFGAILIDIDRFKSINDQYGHGMGDEALKDAVHILHSSLRRDDFVARYGGDEFLVIVDVPNLKSLENTVQRIKERILQFNNEERKAYQLDFSMGHDLYEPSQNKTPDEFIDHLDQLMYQEKKGKQSKI